MTTLWRVARPWLGLAARLVLTGAFVVAGGLKVGDLAESGRAVAAYRILPGEAARMVGAIQPFVEVALGLILLAGFAIRLAGAVSAILLTVFIAGIASVWARGMSIACGCFDSGGDLAAGERANYLQEIIRDVALLLLAVFLALWPRTRLAVDNWIFKEER